MSGGVLAVLSLLPILVVAVFLVMLRWPASRAMPLSYLTASSKTGGSGEHFEVSGRLDR
jgi:hypothetical protein